MQKVKKMTNMFIRYCVSTEKWNNLTTKERKEYHAKLKEHAKKNGFELLLLGPSFGVIESPAWVLRTEKGFNEYLDWLMTTDSLGPGYFSASRTIFLVDAPWS
jgi:hypothetical protein